MIDELKGIIGTREGWEPENELEHFYKCGHCGQSVDKRQLWQVFHHELGKHDQHKTN